MLGSKQFNFFVGATKAAADTDLMTLAQWLACAPCYQRPWPKTEIGLVADFEGLRLFSPGMKPQYWHPGMAHLRMKRNEDPLIKVIAAPKGAQILDCTLGMGHDSLVLTKAGYRVTGIEQCAPLLYFTNQGIHKYQAALARRITFRFGRFERFLTDSEPRLFHTVYLDPMFEKTSKRLDGFTWSMMRTLGLSDSRYTHSDLRAAFKVCTHHVILKLSPFEAPPVVEGLPAPILCGSRRVKYAKWSHKTDHTG